MGFLFYGQTGYSVEIDDRALAHLKVVILSELRAGRAVAFSFARLQAQGGGRETLWIHPATDLRFQFLGGRPPRLNQTWVKKMIEVSSTPTGLHLVEEPAEPTPAVPAPPQA